MQTLENYSTTLAPIETLSALKIAIGMKDLRKMYQTKPITMHNTYKSLQPMKYPKVIRSAYAAIWSGKYTRIIIKAPRGGGKSKLLGTAGFDLWYLKGRKVVNMAGSEVQAEMVYSYFADYCDIDPSIATQIQGGVRGITRSETEGLAGNKFSSVTASEKQVRGKHPDVLISDETCETADGLIHSALPMVNDSPHPLVIMASTFHKIYGVFQETWDNAEQMGYLRIQWDIFDVCKPFSPDIFEQEQYRNILGIQKLKAYAKGRTGDAEGWVPIENVIQAWREKPSESWFEVEYLGNRPSAAGLVLKPEDVDGAMFDNETESKYNYIKGATVVIGIDWGFSSMTAVTELMQHRDQVVVLLDNKNYSQVGSDEIIADVIQKVKEKNIRFIYADSAGKFENHALQGQLKKLNIPCKVIEVVFSKEKVGMVGNLRAHFEQKKIKVPKHFKPHEDGTKRPSLEAYWQYKRYRYQEGSDKPLKENDHIPDSTMCALQHFILGKAANRISGAQANLPDKRKVNQDTNIERVKPITAGLTKKQF